MHALDKHKNVYDYLRLEAPAGVYKATWPTDIDDPDEFDGTSDFLEKWYGRGAKTGLDAEKQEAYVSGLSLSQLVDLLIDLEAANVNPLGLLGAGEVQESVYLKVRGSWKNLSDLLVEAEDEIPEAMRYLRYGPS